MIDHTSRNIGIIGSGQSALVCAHGLLQAGHQVTVYSDRSPEDWLNNSQPTGLATRFAPAVAYERQLGLDHWKSLAPNLTCAHITMSPRPGNRLLTMTGRLTEAVAIDVRLQSYQWMIDLKAKGGHIVLGSVDLPALEEIARVHDLTLVATGKGGLSSLFPIDEKRTVYDKAQRHLTMLCFQGPPLKFDGVPFLAAGLDVLPYAGEAFWIPFHHKDIGPCWATSFEAKWGGPMDHFQDVKSADELLDVKRRVAKKLMPWRLPLLEDAKICDDLGWIKGSFRPVVRKSVGKLPSGKVVASLGDTAFSFDPLAAQGANCGNRMAAHWVNAITAYSEESFTENWIATSFESFWQSHAKHAVDLTNMLTETPPPMVIAYMLAQYGSNGQLHESDSRQALANAYIENFAKPYKLTPTLLNGKETRKFIRNKGGLLGYQLAKTVPKLLKEQARQLLGFDPQHPMAVQTSHEEEH